MDVCSLAEILREADTESPKGARFQGTLIKHRANLATLEAEVLRLPFRLSLSPESLLRGGNHSSRFHGDSLS